VLCFAVLCCVGVSISVSVGGEPSEARRVCVPNKVFVKRDFAAVYSYQRTLCKSVSIWNLFSTAADRLTYRVETIGAPDRFISGFPSWQQKIIPCPSDILSYLI
jgi:hypothetical protein